MGRTRWKRGAQAHGPDFTNSTAGSEKFNGWRTQFATSARVYRMPRLSRGMTV
jgi:hypothetical protein